MGAASSRSSVADVRARLSNLDAARLHDRLQAAFDAFVVAHCEVTPGAHVSVMEMQSAIVAYMQRAGLADALVRWMRLRGGRYRYLFDAFRAPELRDVEVSGCAAYPVLAGILVRSWPALNP